MKKILVCFLIILFVTSCVPKESEHNNVTLTCNHYTEKIFLKNLLKSEKYEVNSKPLAIVVPHNETIMDMTASALKTVAEYDYDSIVLLTINHKAKVGKLLLASADFNTELGTVYGDIETKDAIKNALGGLAIEEYDVVEEDHSASIVMPYIKEYLPDTLVTTMLFTAKLSLTEIQKLADILNELSKEKNILIIGSIDFSHYQNYNDTVMYDNETLNLINNFDIARLRLKDGKNLDSREAMAIILEYAKLKGINNVNILEHRIVSNLPSSDDFGSYMVISINEEE